MVLVLKKELYNNVGFMVVRDIVGLVLSGILNVF